MVKCLKSLETTLKIICNEKNWEYDEKDSFKKLFEICYSNKLIPSAMQSEFTSLGALLESGTPPIRNKYGGHGQGVNEVVVEDYLARYALNITGSCLLFLIEISGIK